MDNTLLKSTTRHIRIFSARVENENLIYDSNKLTLDVDPDNEFIWNDVSINKLKLRFQELVKQKANTEITDYGLRKIGTDLEGLIKQMLQRGEIQYNPECRALNYSMGLPRTSESL
tara:strand:- start:6707 stop:7054 length:348 start_codon:yes stop_codon:yes gene_type:complete